MQNRTWTIEEFVKEFGEFSSIGDAVSAVERQVGEEGAVICRMKINDIDIDTMSAATIADGQFSEIENISIDIDRQDDVVTDIRASITDYMDRVKAAAITTSEQFRSEDLKSAHEMFSSIIDAMACVWDVISDIRITEAAHPISDDRKRQWENLETEFLTLTKEISEAYEAQDLFLVSDLLEYELPNQLDIWAGHIKK